MSDRHRSLPVIAVTGAMLLLATTAARAQDDGPAPAGGGTPFDKLVAGAKVHDGLVRLHLKGRHLYAEIGPSLLDKPMIWPVAVSKGAGFGDLLGGMTRNFDDDWVMVFRKVDDQIQLVRKNVRFRAKPGTPAAAAVERAFTDSVMAGLRILSTNPARGTSVVDLGEVFFNDLAGVQQDLRGYFLDRNLSSFAKVKVFPENAEIQVACVFRSPAGFAPPTVADPRSITVHIHYSLSMLPAEGYKPRPADDRIGYFLTAVKDYTKEAGDASYVRMINRWRLEKVDPAAKTSAPKKPIRFWIERTVPHEFRRYVREGVLEWNKAFEKLGFTDAVEVRQQDDHDDFDPEDIRFNTIRWITADAGFAIGPSRVSPLTGEILDADILFDASLLHFEQQEFEVLTADPAKMLDFEPGPNDGFPGRRARDVKACAHGSACRHCAETAHSGQVDPAAANAGWRSFGGANSSLKTARCTLATGLKREMFLGLAALQAQGLWKPGEPVPMEFLGHSVKHTIMHEVGHTLGLRHNFKSSSIAPLSGFNDPKNPAQFGSVMDYIPINIAPKGSPQGPWGPDTIGPYDHWAIEYGYTTEDGKLAEIASRAARPELAYATDEDTYRADGDPLSNVWDIGDDPLAFGKARIELLRQLVNGLPERVTAKGAGWQPARRALGMLMSTHTRTSWYAAKLAGGWHVHRDHFGDPEARNPLVPVPAERQRAALAYLRTHVFDETNLKVDPVVLQRLAPARWYHWGANPMGADLVYPYYNQVLATQRLALFQLLSESNLRRIREAEAALPAGAEYLGLGELFRTLTDSVWGDALKTVPDRVFNDRNPLLGTARRALQRSYVLLLAEYATPLRPGSEPADVRALARLQLRRIAAMIDIELPGKLKAAGRKNTEADDISDAHLQDLRDIIRKVLDAGVVVVP